MTTAKLSPDCRLLSSTEWNGKSWMWDVTTGRRMGDGYFIFSPDRRVAAAWYRDGVRLFDAVTFRELRRVDGEAFAFSHDRGKRGDDLWVKEGGVGSRARRREEGYLLSSRACPRHGVASSGSRGRL